MAASMARHGQSKVCDGADRPHACQGIATSLLTLVLALASSKGCLFAPSPVGSELYLHLSYGLFNVTHFLQFLVRQGRRLVLINTPSEDDSSHAEQAHQLCH